MPAVLCSLPGKCKYLIGEMASCENNQKSCSTWSDCWRHCIDLLNFITFHMVNLLLKLPSQLHTVETPSQPLASAEGVSVLLQKRKNALCHLSTVKYSGHTHHTLKWIFIFTFCVLKVPKSLVSLLKVFGTSRSSIHHQCRVTLHKGLRGITLPS